MPASTPPNQQAGFLARMQQHDLPPTFVDEQNRLLARLTTAGVDALSKKYLAPGQLTLLVVGGKARIRPGLRRPGYQLSELDTNGNPLKTNLN